MKIPLSTFEQHIPETILSRGLSYWKKGSVSDLEWIEKDQVEAIVSGSEEYEVSLTIKIGNLTDCECNCPFEADICKHVVAVLFELQKNEIGEDLTGKPASKKTKKKSLKTRLKETLENLTLEQLQDYILELANEDRDFRNNFLARFSMVGNEPTKEEYAAQIRDIKRAVAGRHGYIDYYSSSAVSLAVSGMLENTKQGLEKGSGIGSAWALARAVAEEMGEAMRHADDSNGDIGGCVSQAIELMRVIIQVNTETKLQQEIFDYCLKASGKDIFTDFDWEYDFILIAAGLILTEEEEKAVFAALTEMEKRSPYSGRQAIQIRHSILKQRHPEQAHAWLEQNRHVPEMRKQLLNEAFSKADFLRVKELANEGMVHDKEYAGLVHQWKDWLLQTAIAEKDAAETARLSRNLFLGSHREMQYFELFREHTPESEWPGTLATLVAELTKEKNYWPVHTLAEIYVKEKQWENLLGIVKKEPTFQFLMKYEEILKDKFPAEFSDMYRKSVLSFVAQVSDRSRYAEACQALKRMKKLGYTQEVISLVNELKDLYKRRPALLDELKKV